jgi:HEAT repeat protein
MVIRRFLARPRIAKATMLLVLMPLLLSGVVGFPAEQSLRGLLEELQHPENASARFRAAELIADYDLQAVPPLRSLLSHDDVRVRSCACSALSRLGPTAQGAVPDLLAMARDPQECEVLRGYAILALGRIGPAAASAVPELQSLLRENAGPDLWRRVGPDACRATEFLLPLLEDTDPNVRWEAVSAIVNTDPAAITEDSWRRLLYDPEPEVRRRAGMIRSTIR